MSRAQEHLAQANGHIAELKVQIVRQRVIVKYAMAESLLDALEGSLRIFEKHRVLILGQLPRQPSE
jgi:dihydroxyacid dehydratase/phosphogluconate dehydratase